MKRILLLFVMASFTGLWTLAADITPEQALQQARQFMLNKMQHQGKGKQAPAVAPQMKLAGRVSDLYVFNVLKSNGGYVIVSNDDCAVPVLGYSERGSLDIENMPENMRAWLQGYADEIAWAKEHPIKAVPSLRRAKSKMKTPIEPLMPTRWNQNSPYNDLCPEYAPGMKCASGCGATAMAQCMYYTEMHAGSTTTYTTTDIPGYTTKTRSLEIDGIAAGTPIDWYKMSPVYTNGDTGEAAEAVAQLMKYCGVSVEMNYGPESSAALDAIANALKAYFGYDETVTFEARSNYSYADWIEMMYHELSLGRVICYRAGKASGEGHIFACDGYQGEDFFHINWGWGGMSDDYFKLSALNPDAEGIGGVNSEGGYCIGHYAVVGIQKVGEDLGDVLQVEPYVFDGLQIGTVTMDKNQITGGESVEVTVPFYNGNDSKAFDGEIALIDISENGYGIVASTIASIPVGQIGNSVLKFTPKDETHDYKLRVAVLHNFKYYFWGDQKLVLSVTGSGRVTTDEIELTWVDQVINNFEVVDHKGVLYSNKLEAFAIIMNDAEDNYSGNIVIEVYEINNNNYLPKGRSSGPHNIPAKSVAVIPFGATGLTAGKSYLIVYTYNQNGSWSEWNQLPLIECRPAIIVTDGEGNATAIKPTATYDVPANATSVNLTACGVGTVNKNSNPNTLYILGAGETVPAGLTNVITDHGNGNYTAETITLTDGQNFLTPVDFTAEKVEFVYNNTKQGNGTKGWNTLMLPFKTTKVTADGTTIDWFHSSTDGSGQFWLKRFTGDDLNKVYFDYEANDYVEANTPFIIVIPSDLSGKAIKFVGENTTIHKTDDVSPFTAENYILKGSTSAVGTENIYRINATGDSFVLGNGCGAFRAYFKPVSFNPAVTTLRIVNDGTTGVDATLVNSEKVNSDVYDLQGRRVLPLKKGIYITNGKKVVVN